MMKFTLSALALLASRIRTTHGLNNGLGKTPALGWNSWNAFAAELDEKVVRETAALLVSTGLAAKGYVYLNLDDTWAAWSRSTTGELLQNSSKFPTPMTELVDDVHKMGLLFGIYTDVGSKTCAKRPGSYGYETQDATLFASWKVDFVKADSCFTGIDPASQPANGSRCTGQYKVFEAALNATGHPMVHSVKGPCGTAAMRAAGDPPCSPTDASAFANLRRTSADAKDAWSSMTRILEDAAAVSMFSRPGYFGDMDILEIGNGGLSASEEQAVFALWCAIKSPLLLGNDLSSMSPETLAVVGNTQLLAINQDALGVAARRVHNSTTVQVWAGPLAGGDTVAVLLNLGDGPALISAALTTLGVTRSTVKAVDMWSPTHKSKQVQGNLTAVVDSHGVAAFRLSPA